MTDTYDAISLESIRACSRALSDVIVRTPVLQWLGENRRNGEALDVWLKLELFQHTGTFKARGALNAVRHLDSIARSRGITAVSAGNHAIAAAFAARECGTTAKVVMIRTANEARIRRARSYGAEILFADDGRSAFAMAEEISRVEGRAMIHPFEGPYVAQGAGTLGLEFVEQVADLDAVIIAIGGGGLCGGAAAAIKQCLPRCKVFGVEPEGADSMRRSFESGGPITMTSVKTIADSLAPPMSLPYSFGACRRFVDEVVTVSDDQMRAAMRILFDDLKLAVEPAGTAATAALLGPLRQRLTGLKVGVVICGSNIDFASFADHVRLATPS
ncbi:MAG TPA: pyridoxal-phosphate dependent enzyme [Steroidobacteraceae bacterium]|nr:pyridoxal-phosphate dependent enzyme [Steroidobacteraceae bacterium]